MTHDALATLLRDDVAATEPAHRLDAMIPVRLGRRRLRHRRVVGTAAAGVASIVVAVAGAAALTASPAGPKPSPSAEPAALARITSVTDEHVRAVLERSDPDLGRARVTGSDASHAVLPADELSRATEVYVSYGSLEHSYAIAVTRAREPLDDVPDWCAPEESSQDLTCTTTTLADGSRLTTSLYAVRPIGENPDGHPTDYEFAVVPKDSLALVDQQDLFFVREVTMESSSATVRAFDQVHAPDRSAAEAALVVPIEDVEGIVADPALLGIAADPNGPVAAAH